MDKISVETMLDELFDDIKRRRLPEPTVWSSTSLNLVVTWKVGEHQVYLTWSCANHFECHRVRNAPDGFVHVSGQDFINRQNALDWIGFALRDIGAKFEFDFEINYGKPGDVFINDKPIDGYLLGVDVGREDSKAIVCHAIQSPGGITIVACDAAGW